MLSIIKNNQEIKRLKLPSTSLPQPSIFVSFILLSRFYSIYILFNNHNLMVILLSVLVCITHFSRLVYFTTTFSFLNLSKDKTTIHYLK